MPHNPFYRLHYRTALLAVLAVFVPMLAFLGGPPAAAAGNNPALSVTKITDLIPGRVAPPSAAPYFTTTLTVQYPGGTAPALISDTLDGLSTFNPNDHLQVLVNGQLVYDKSYILPDCMGSAVPDHPVNIGPFLKTGTNQVTFNILNDCATVASWPGYLVVGPSGTTAPYDPPSNGPPPPIDPRLICAPAKFFGVRGSGEHNGFGPTMDALESAMRENVPGIHTQFVSYRAIDVDVTPWHITYPADYVNSVQNGVDALKAAMNDYWKMCPKNYVVLGGYSQGAEVVRKAFAELKQKQQSLVASVVLFGDPLFNPKDTSIDRGNYSPLWSGIDISLYHDKATKVHAKWSQRFQDYCTIGDPVCSFYIPYALPCIGTSTTMISTCPHLQYVQRGWVTDSISGVVAQLKVRHVL